MSHRLVYVVDDEEHVRRSLQLLLRASGWKVSGFASGRQFIAELPRLISAPLLLDVRMAGFDGLQVQGELKRLRPDMPIVMMTGHGDLSIALAALRAGAIDFLEKPFGKEVLLDALHRARLKLTDPAEFARAGREVAGRISALDPAEKEVLRLLAEGASNQSISESSGISLAEVERYRATAMEKIGAGQLSDAVRMLLAVADSEFADFRRS